MRKIHDFYFKKAKEERFHARSVYKLQEIDQKHRIIKKGAVVLDIGCAPGSWSQYLLKKIGSGTVVGIDLKEKVGISDPRFTYMRGDIFDLELASLSLPVPGFDLVVSDASPDTSGHRFTDSQRSLAIVRRVFSIAGSLLKPGGSVVAKVFEGEDLKSFIDEVRHGYSRAILFKPRSTRKESKEIFIIAFHRRPR